jgi:hypothetical protein
MSKLALITKKLCRAFGWLILFIIVLAALLLAYAGYKIKHSKSVATGFCNSIKIGQNITDVIATAQKNNIYHSEQKTDEMLSVSHTFYIPGFIYSFSSCHVTAIQGKVSAKEVIISND